MPPRPVFFPSPLVPFPLPDTTPSLPSLFSFPAPFSHSSALALFRRPRHPSTGSLPALLRLLGTSPLRPSAPPPFLHHSAKQDRTEGLCSVLFGRTEGLRSVIFGRTKSHGQTIFGRTEGQTRPNRGPPFDPIWPNGAGKEGALGLKRAGTRKPGRGAGREHVPGSKGRVMGKGEETGRRGGARKGEEGGTGEEMYRGRGVWREKGG